MKNFYILAASLVSAFTFAQNGVIAGKITDGNNQFSLPGATIKIENSNRYTISDQNGSYQFLNLPEGSYTVYVEYIGYLSAEQEGVVTPTQTTTANFSMFTGSEELEEIVTTGDFLRGQPKALSKQRNNPTITNIISSHQVGGFPDAKIGDALNRV